MRYYTDIFYTSNDINLKESALYMDKLDLEIDKYMSVIESVFMFESDGDETEASIKKEGILKKIKEAILSLIKKIRDTFDSFFKKHEKFDVDEFISTNKDVRAEFSLDYEQFAKILDEEYYKSHKVAKFINKITGKDAQAIKDAEINLSYIGADATEFLTKHAGTITKVGAVYISSRKIIKSNKKLNKINTEIEDRVRKITDPDDIAKLNIFRRFINKNADLINKANRVFVKSKNEISLIGKSGLRVSKYNGKDGLDKKIVRNLYHKSPKTTVSASGKVIDAGRDFIKNPERG